VVLIISGCPAKAWAMLAAKTLNHREHGVIQRTSTEEIRIEPGGRSGRRDMTAERV
jgi:hypothetical protein